VSVKTKISFTCYLLLAVLVTGMAGFYVFTPRILPYHEEVLGVTWEQLQPGYQLIFLSFFKIAGALCLASVLALLFLLFIPFRRGEAWARWAIPIFQLPSLAALNYVPINIALTTTAHPPLAIFFVGDALLVAGFLFSLDIGKPRSK
jgi:hypothetical protein